jgi:hypothetical protein
MQPGLARAVPLGILGFTIGVILARFIRLLQGIEYNPADPNAFVGSAMVLGAFFSAGFFIWGMGAFDPKMNVHGEHAEEAHEEEAPASPIQILAGYTWQILFWVIILVVAVAAFAFLPSGPYLQSVQGDGDPAAINQTTLGQLYNPIREFANDAAGVQLPVMDANTAAISVSYLTVFVLVVAWTILSLFLVAGLIAFIFSYLSTAVRNPEPMPVPWRIIVLVLLMVGLVQFPIIAPTMDVPMAFIVPAYLIPPLVLLIAYRNPIWAILLLIGLALPILVPSVNLGNVWIVYNLLGLLIVEILFFQVVKYFTSETTWQRLTAAVYGLTVLGAIFYTIITAAPDFWQIVFLVVVIIGVALLLLPIYALKMIIPSGVWARFAAVQWTRVVPQAAGWLADFLRSGLPKLLGQR